MRALFVAHSYPRFDGDAAGSFILRLARALASERVDVLVLAPSAPGLAPRAVIGDVPVQRFRYAPTAHETLAYTGTMAESVARSGTSKAALGSLVVAESAAVLRAIRSFRPDVVHAHWWFPGGLAAAAVTTVSSVPLITTCHGSDLRLLEKKPAAAPLARFVLGRSARVTCVSTWLAAVAQRVAGVTAEVAPMPVDTALFTPGGARAADRILFVGRLTKQKGIGDAIRAVASMQARATLHVVGDGSDGDDARQLAQELGIAERVKWLGQLDQRQLAGEYARSVALVMPSTGEGLGLVAVEAALCETPTVGYASGGLLDVIRDGETGSLVTPGDIEPLARALDALVASSELRERRGRAARAAALNVFSPEQAAARYHAIYNSAVTAA